MKLLIRLTVLVLLVCLFLPFTVSVRAVGELSISAVSACLIDAESGRLIYGKNPDRRLPMASTTKIMTAIVALESGLELSSVVSVPRSAVGVEGSSAYLREGERLTLESLLYCLLLSSANDAAVAIALSVGGSVDAFVAKMNLKAAELGMSNTHFTNPHGLHDADHYTTARDLADLLAYAVKNADFLRISGSYRATLPREGGGVSVLTNHNRLLRTYSGVLAGKTGYTRVGGRCLATYAERDGVRLVAVTLNAPNDWADHARLYDFGFSSYEAVELERINTVVPVISGVSTEVGAISEPISVLLPRERGDIRTIVELPRFIFAPIGSGEQIGQVKYLLGDSVIATSPIRASGEVSEIRYTFNLLKFIEDLFWELLRWIG